MISSSKLQIIFLLSFVCFIGVSLAGEGKFSFASSNDAVTCPVPQDSVEANVIVDAQTQNIRTIVCCSATSVVTSACACHLAPMDKKNVARVTITGRPKKADQNALENFIRTN
ncbi:hypothetical protein CASFOL_008612 [Castilleja foliolosa]|uniref:Uncharacterized protein n=1 Tax=Castilleja foliolosa TaxID=1961234 RepID=A0ABD3E3I6_9LAMI